MEIRAKGVLDYESAKALAHVAAFKRANPKKNFITWVVITSVFALICILEMIIFSDPEWGSILYLVIILLLLEVYLYFLLPKITYKALANMSGVENEFVFYDDALKIYTKSKDYNGEAEVTYSLFVRVYETSKYLFLYKTNNQVFVVDKHTVEGGSVEEIRNKLTSFVKNKYVICNY